MTSRERFLAACRCAPLDRPPCWIMRQAGRFLPDYRAVRAAHSFAEMVHDPELAAEVTLQPVRRFGFDAAILFSDILAVPEAMGVGYTLKEGEGIEMERRVESRGDVENLVAEDSALFERIGYVYDAMQQVRGELGSGTALLGFAGSPWTLACYLAEGRGAAGGAFTRALHLADEDPAAFRLLMEKLSDAVALHLTLQLCAGADAVQIFDSWAAAAPSSRYGELSLKWIHRIVSQMPDGVPVIVYAKGVSSKAREIAASGARIVSVDHSTDLRAVADALPGDVAVQGNLDPALMEGSPEAVKSAAGRLLESMRGRNGFIANLGHGITPAARAECVAAFVDAVRNFK